VGNGHPGAVFGDISISAQGVANVITHTVLELYEGHYEAMVRLACVVVCDLQAAEEIVQDTFLAMLTGGWQLRDGEKALAYLRQAIVNRSRSVVRHRIVIDKHLQKHSPDMPSAEHGALTLLERDAVVSALRELTDRQREAIVLRYYAGLSEAETASAMGISPGSVKSHVSRAMVSLRETLEPQLS
jgi:RNA polymerase sigma-70 factor (sigma-E family)